MIMGIWQDHERGDMIEALIEYSRRRESEELGGVLGIAKVLVYGIVIAIIVVAIFGVMYWLL